VTGAGAAATAPGQIYKDKFYMVTDDPSSGKETRKRILPLRRNALGWAITTIHWRSIPGYDFAAASQGLDEQGIQRELEINWHVASGKRVIPEYSDEMHLSKEPLVADPDLPLHIGIDVPGTPACVVTQINKYGQWMVLSSLSPDEKTEIGVYEFGQMMADHLLREYAAPHGLGLDDLKLVFVGDPAGRNRPARTGSRRQETRAAWEVLRVGSRLYCGTDDRGEEIYEERPGWGWHIIPGPIDITTRLEALKARLTRILPGGLPAFVLNCEAHFLRLCFLGLYSFREYSDGTFSREPDKGHASHSMDCLCYLAARLHAQPVRRAHHDEDAPQSGYISKAASRRHYG
jgi:hypothetical protein